MSTGKWTQADVDAAMERVGRVRPVLIDTTPAAVVNAIMAKGFKTPRPSKMNKTEAEYASILEAEQRAGRITAFKFEGVTLKLGDDCRFTPDFFVVDCDGFVQFHDVKAIHRGKTKPHIEDDARCKLSVSASTIFPFFEFRTVWKRDNIWQHKVY